MSQKLTKIAQFPLLLPKLLIFIQSGRIWVPCVVWRHFSHILVTHFFEMRGNFICGVTSLQIIKWARSFWAIFWAEKRLGTIQKAISDYSWRRKVVKNERALIFWWRVSALGLRKFPRKVLEQVCGKTNRWEWGYQSVTR